MSYIPCPACGATEHITMERRPDGFAHCTTCGHRWQPTASPKKSPSEPLIESITKIHLEPGDDLIVKLRGFEMDEMESLRSLKNMLEEKYPENRVLVFYLPEGTDINFSIIKKI